MPNGTNHVVRSALTARLRYGPDMTSATTYLATAGHPDHATVQFVDPGEVSYRYTLGPAARRRNFSVAVGLPSRSPTLYRGGLRSKPFSFRLGPYAVAPTVALTAVTISFVATSAAKP